MAGQPVMTEAVKARGDVEVLAVSPGIASRSTTATRQSFPAANQNQPHGSPEKLRFARRPDRPVDAHRVQKAAGRFSGGSGRGMSADRYSAQGPVAPGAAITVVVDRPLFDPVQVSP
jgi:hypothetical protein